jgi:O-methyltransferase involved in polyketide biosynthesis
VYYLPPEAFKGLLNAISDNAVLGSRLFFDFINLSTMSGEGAGRGAPARAGRKGRARPLHLRTRHPQARP